MIEYLEFFKEIGFTAAEINALLSSIPNKIDKGTIKDGKSAYEIAVANGYRGSEEQWLESLRGPKGDALEYEDLTPEQIEELKKPASEVAEQVSEALSKAEEAASKAEEAVQNSRKIWRPNLDGDGNLSWDRSETLEAPETQNIKGPQGNSGITGNPDDLDVINDLNGGESTPGSIKVLAAEQGKVLDNKITSHKNETDRQFSELKGMIEDVSAGDIVINGDVTNNADNEDIESVINPENAQGILRFKSRNYNPANFIGKGYNILRRNIVEGKNIVTQEMISKSDTAYEIKYDFDLNGETLNLPDNCLLYFNGGSLNNGTVKVNRTVIKAGSTHIFKNLNLTSDSKADSGAYINGLTCDALSPYWFGAKGDGVTDDSEAIQQALIASLDFKLPFYGAGNFVIKKNVYLEEYYPTAHLDNRGGGQIRFSGSLIVDNCDGLIVLTSGLSFKFDKVMSVNNGGFIKFLDCGFNSVKFAEANGKGSSRDGIVIAGAYDSGIYGNNIIGYNKDIHCRKSDASDNISLDSINYTAKKYGPNNTTIKVLRIGGNFNTIKTDPLSSEYGIYLANVNSAWIEAQIEYVIRSEDSVGLYIDSNCVNINVKTYLESCNKHYVECYGSYCDIYSTIMTTNRKLQKDIYIRGVKNTFRYEHHLQTSNLFLNNITPEPLIDISSDNIYEDNLDELITDGWAINRMYNTNDVRRLSGYSPTGGTSNPTIDVVFDENLSNAGGGFCSKIVSNDGDNVYQRSGNFAIVTTNRIYMGCMLKAEGEDARFMLKAIAGDKIYFKQCVVGAGTGWQKLNMIFPIDFDSLSQKQIDFSISYIIPTGGILYVANLYGLERKPFIDVFPNYGTVRPTSLGVFNGFANLGIYGRKKEQCIEIAYEGSDVELTSIEAPIYVLKAIDDNIGTVKLPAINANNTYKTIVRFCVSKKTSNGFWRLEAKNTDRFSNGNQYFNLSKYGGTITLYAFNGKWYILENSMFWGGEENPSPVASYEGALFYNETDQKYYIFLNGAWKATNITYNASV